MLESVDALERQRLCDLILVLGPDAPTLCGDWRTGDLAAHIVLRDHFRRTSAASIARKRQGSFPELVAEVQAGPPWPWKIPYLGARANAFEFIVHHEDVRRANGYKPRTNIPEVERLAWELCRWFGRRLARAVRPYSLEIKAIDFGAKLYRDSDPVVLRGRPVDLLLYLAGRQSAAEIAFSGPPNAIERVQGASLDI